MRSLFCALALLFLTPILAPAQTNVARYEPQYFLALGGSYNHYATPPQAAGFVSLSVRIAAGTYSISTIDLTQTTSSVRTGLARILTQSGNFTLLAHADGGLTTGTIGASSLVTLGSFSGGGMLLYDLKRVSPRLEHIYLVGVMRLLAINATAVQSVFEFGIGRGF